MPFGYLQVGNEGRLGTGLLPVPVPVPAPVVIYSTLNRT